MWKDYIWKKEIKLRPEQKKAIEDVFKRHSINLTDPDYDWWWNFIEQECSRWRHYKRIRKNGIIGKVEMLREIKQLRRALQKLSRGTLRQLEECAGETDIHRTLDETGQLTPLLKTMEWSWWKAHPHNDDGRNLMRSLFDICCVTLHEASDVALKRLKAATGEGVTTTVVHHATKVGRPRNHEDIELIQNMADLYWNATGREPSDNPDGPFHSFLNAVFNIADPECEHSGAGNRKLMRKVLGNTYRMLNGRAPGKSYKQVASKRLRKRRNVPKYH